MSEVGDRLREERERLGLTQDALGVTSKTQRLYENGERSPDAAYLKNFSQLGADVLYILNGQRAGGTLAPELQCVLNAWRSIPPRHARLAAHFARMQRRSHRLHPAQPPYSG